MSFSSRGSEHDGCIEYNRKTVTLRVTQRCAETLNISQEKLVDTVLKPASNNQEIILQLRQLPELPTSVKNLLEKVKVSLPKALQI